MIKEYRPDPTDATGRFGMVDIKAVKAPAAAGDVGGDQGGAGLKGMMLVDYSRLSVQPVTDEEWSVVCRMGGLG